MGKGIVKLGEGNWAVKDGNLLAAKETNGRFKNAEFTVARGTDATYVGRDGLIKRFSSGLANEVANGDFELGDNGDWTLPSGWSISNNQLVGNDPTGFATVNDVFYANKSYRLDIDVAEVDSGDFTILPNSTDSNSNATTAIGSTGLHTFYFHIGTIDLATLYVTFGGDFVGKINSITVRDIEDFDDTPRIDFTDNTDGHLLLEPQSTNFLPYSNDFSQSNWVKQTNITHTYNTTETLSPDGTYNATKLVGNGTDGIYDSSLSITGDVTRSVYLKSVSGTINVKLKDSNVDIGTETLTVTTEWQRFYLSGDNGTSSQGIWIDDIPLSGIYIFGAQVENLSYPTSYIPTNGSTVTRDADTCTGSGEAADFNSEEGVLYFELSSFYDDANSLSINDGSSSKRITARVRPDISKIQLSVVGSTDDFSYNSATIDLSINNKIAIVYNNGDYYFYVNGVKSSVQSRGTFSANDFTNLDFNRGGSNEPFYGKCKAIRVYKEALSDSELTTLTS